MIPHDKANPLIELKAHLWYPALWLEQRNSLRAELRSFHPKGWNAGKAKRHYFKELGGPLRQTAFSLEQSSSLGEISRRGIPPSLFSFILDSLTSERTTVGIESRELNPAFGQLAPGCPGIERLDSLALEHFQYFERGTQFYPLKQKPHF